MVNKKNGKLFSFVDEDINTYHIETITLCCKMWAYEMSPSILPAFRQINNKSRNEIEAKFISLGKH